MSHNLFYQSPKDEHFRVFPNSRYHMVIVHSHAPMCVCLVAQSCLTLCDPMDFSPPGSSVHGGSPGKNTGVGYHFLLQGIPPTKG